MSGLSPAENYNKSVNVWSLARAEHLPNVRVYSHVTFFRRKLWASKAMYRGSAANFLALQGFCANPGIPPQMPQKSDYTHLDNFLRLSSI